MLWVPGVPARPSRSLRPQNILPVLRPHRIKYGIVDRVSSSIASNHCRCVSFADTDRKLDALNQRIRSQIPAIEHAVLAVNENRLAEGIDRRRVDAPLLNSSRAIRIG